MGIIGFLIKLGTGFISTAGNVKIAKHKSRAAILSSVTGLLFAVLLFMAWVLIKLSVIVFGYVPAGGVEAMLGFADEILYIFLGVLGVAAPAGMFRKKAQIRQIKKNLRNTALLDKEAEQNKSNTVDYGLVLRRCYKENRTEGRLYIDGANTGISILELPRLYEGSLNVPSKTCILEGVYKIQIEPALQSGRFKKTGVVFLHDVPGRSGIFIHPANWTHEIKGCLAPGTSIKLGMAQNSRDATRELIKLIKDKGITELTIRK